MGEGSKSDRNEKGREKRGGGGEGIKEMEKNKKINHLGWRDTQRKEE